MWLLLERCRCLAVIVKEKTLLFLAVEKQTLELELINFIMKRKVVRLHSLLGVASYHGHAKRKLRSGCIDQVVDKGCSNSYLIRYILHMYTYSII